MGFNGMFSDPHFYIEPTNGSGFNQIKFMDLVFNQIKYMDLVFNQIKYMDLVLIRLSIWIWF